MSNSRKKLETAVERQTYKFINTIKESSSDAVMLWANRARLDMDTALLQQILDQFKNAMESEYMAKCDLLINGISKELDEFTGTEREVRPSQVEAPKARKNSKKNAQV